MLYFERTNPTHSVSIVLGWSTHSKRLVWNICAIIEIICLFSREEECDVHPLTVGGQNEDVTVSVMCDEHTAYTEGGASLKSS